MHDIEKLKEDLAQKRSELRVARQQEESAALALQAAINENSGIVGHVLAYPLRRGYGKNSKVIDAKILVHRVGENYNLVPVAYGKRIIANGAVGLLLGDTEISKATDLGPYVEPAK